MNEILDIEKEIYPTALFNTSSLPLKSWEAADDGSYFNQINKYQEKLNHFSQSYLYLNENFKNKKALIAF